MKQIISLNKFEKRISTLVNMHIHEVSWEGGDIPLTMVQQFFNLSYACTKIQNISPFRAVTFPLFYIHILYVNLWYN